MMVCHCNRLTDRALCEAARKLASEPDRQLVTPGAVFRACGVRPRCGGCFPLVVEVVHSHTDGVPVAEPVKRIA